MSDAVPVVKLSIDRLREVMQQAGYRVETVSDPLANMPYLRSATAGLAFDVRPGNRLDGGDIIDAVFSAVLQVQGALPLDPVNRWNATRRFGRLQLSHPFLVFSMDVSVAGGVMPDHLRAQIEIWDRLVQELIVHLREELARLGAANGATEPRGAVAAPEPAALAAPDPSATIQ